MYPSELVQEFLDEYDQAVSRVSSHKVEELILAEEEDARRGEDIF